MKSAVLLLVFNRPEFTRTVFDVIRIARPPRLYIACDGPRANVALDKSLVAETRKIVSRIDWPCAVSTRFLSNNLGCRVAVSGAVSWFFEKEPQGIILEDDCLPHADFFTYCDELLEYYKQDERVFAIAGSNFQNGITRGEADYYFSMYNHIWGWATWRRAWRHYDLNMRFWYAWKHSDHWKSMWSDPQQLKYWETLFDLAASGDLDTWDYQWTACVWRHRGLTAVPNVNLISNIGFNSHATHTKQEHSPLAALPLQSLHGQIRHPLTVSAHVAADSYTYDYCFRKGFSGVVRRSLSAVRDFARRYLRVGRAD